MENILLDRNNKIQICDFGESKIITDGIKINEKVGTPAYIAPEIISKEVNIIRDMKDSIQIFGA